MFENQLDYNLKIFNALVGYCKSKLIKKKTRLILSGVGKNWNQWFS
jgi:hypothetical protein